MPSSGSSTSPPQTMGQRSLKIHASDEDGARRHGQPESQKTSDQDHRFTPFLGIAGRDVAADRSLRAVGSDRDQEAAAPSTTLEMRPALMAAR